MLYIESIKLIHITIIRFTLLIPIDLRYCILKILKVWAASLWWGGDESFIGGGRKKVLKINIVLVGQKKICEIHVIIIIAIIK